MRIQYSCKLRSIGADHRPICLESFLHALRNSGHVATRVVICEIECSYYLLECDHTQTEGYMQWSWLLLSENIRGIQERHNVGGFLPLLFGKPTRRKLLHPAAHNVENFPLLIRLSQHMERKRPLRLQVELREGNIMWKTKLNTNNVK